MLNTPDFMNGNGWACDVLATDPADPNRVYAASTGSNGQFLADAIVRSDNGGASWVNIGVGANGTGPRIDHHALAFDTLGRLWDGSDGGIYATADLGGNWIDANTDLGIDQLNGIAIDPARPALVFGGSQDNGTEERSGSSTWTQIDSGDGGQVRYDPLSNTVYHTFFYAKGQTGFFQRSNNGGASFQTKTTGIDVLDDNALFFPPCVLDPSTPGRLLLGTNRLYATNNRGDLWTPISPALGSLGSVITAIAIAPSNSQIIYVTYSDNTVWATLNGGGTWSRRATVPVIAAGAAGDPDGGDGLSPAFVGQLGSDGARRRSERPVTRLSGPKQLRRFGVRIAKRRRFLGQPDPQPAELAGPCHRARPSHQPGDPLPRYGHRRLPVNRRRDLVVAVRDRPAQRDGD